MGLKPEQNEAVREAMRLLLHERYDGNESALARALDLKQSTVNRFLKGDSPGTSLEVAQRVAKLAKVPVTQLLGWSDVAEPISQEQPDRAPTFGDLPEWMPLEQSIRASRAGRRFTDEAARRARATQGGNLKVHLTEAVVFNLLQLWQTILDDAEEAAANRTELEEETRKAQARHRSRKAVGAEGDSPPAPTVKPKSGPRGKH